MKLKLKPVNSSCLKATHYLRKEKAVIVEFNNGGLYKYDNVEYKTYYHLRNNGNSVGQFYCSQIKGKYACNKL
jgi:hypothetical protein